MTEELQRNIIEEVMACQNQETLETILGLVRTIRLPAPFVLNDAQKRSIAISQEQIRNGATISHEEFMRQTEDWLRTQ
jgi:hypothetical protein